jgi:6-phosphogluconolactonase/glucosamine-6-phosphate isomerase/deaminase
MIDDLEALYFNDKVHMRSNSAAMKKIPKLNFTVVDERMAKNNQQESNANNVVVNMNNLNKIDDAKKQLKVFLI